MARRRRRGAIIGIVAAVVVALVIGAVILLADGDSEDATRTPPPTPPTTSDVPSTRPTTEPTEGTEPTTIPRVGVSPADLGIEIAGADAGAADTIPGGATAELTAAGFAPSSPVTVTLRSDPIVIGTGAADVGGELRLSVQIPADTPAGTHTIEVSGTGPGGEPLIVSREITVVGSLPSTAVGELPNTGARHQVGVLVSGLALLVLGLALVAIAGPRRRLDALTLGARQRRSLDF